MILPNPIVPLSTSQVKAAELTTAKESRIRRILVAFDIFCNVLLLNGQEDETISTHSARAAFAGRWWGIVMSWFLNLFQKDHGAQASAGDLERAENLEKIEEKSGILK